MSKLYNLAAGRLERQIVELAHASSQKDFAAGVVGVGIVVCGVAQLSFAAATILTGLVIVGAVVMLVRQR
jgi:hypothetical protein